MKVLIDDNSGFCFGVVRAISRAEEALAEGGTVYSLGDIVHNRVEVQRLEELGLQTVSHEDMDHLGGRRLFIRAHGEPPTTYARAEQLGIEVIDATCPVVAALQRKVKRAYEQMQACGGQATDYQLDGESMLDMLNGGEEKTHDYIFWEMEGQTAVRHGKYKLVLNGRLEELAQPRADVFLSDLEADPAEQNNLAHSMPELAQQLTQKALDWRKDVEANWDETFAKNYLT